MQIKLYQILNFSQFYTMVQNQKIPFSLSYKIALVQREAQKHSELYQQELHKIIEEYGEKDANGSPIVENERVKIDQTRIQECYSKMTELENIEIDIPEIYSFNASELELLELTPIEVNAILPFIKQ